MAVHSTTRLSSKGQVVIPEPVRRALGLNTGDQFVVLGEGDAVVLKTLAQPDGNSFRALLAEARRQSRQAGLTRADLKAAVAKVRRGKR